MLAVGLWSALAARRLWLAPLALQRCCWSARWPAGGPGGAGRRADDRRLAAGVGLLVATRARVPAAAAAALVGAFAFFHGVAHGANSRPAMQGLAPLAGMLLATALLHGAGLGWAAPPLARQRHAGLAWGGRWRALWRCAVAAPEEDHDPRRTPHRRRRARAQPRPPHAHVVVQNTADRPIQVGSHYHFAETNGALGLTATPRAACG
jgi:hypothetical protein